jgi:hypothetical protein
MVLSAPIVGASCSVLQRRLQSGSRRAGIGATFACAAIALAACGGSSQPSGNPAKLLAQTLSASSSIHSGVLSITADVSLDGVSSLHGPITLQASGPFTSANGKPAFDLSMTATVSGQTIPLGVLSTGKGLYLQFAGTYYSLPAATASASVGASGAAGLVKSLGIKPTTLLTNTKLLGTPTVDGVKTDHLSTQINVNALVALLEKVLKREKGVSGVAASTLNASTLNQLSSAITTATVDLYPGTSDHIARRVAVAFAFTVPTGAASSTGGLTGGSFKFTADITNLNATETIKAPASSQPFSALLGGSGGLLSGLGA